MPKWPKASAIAAAKPKPSEISVIAVGREPERHQRAADGLEAPVACLHRALAEERRPARLVDARVALRSGPRDVDAVGRAEGGEDREDAEGAGEVGHDALPPLRTPHRERLDGAGAERQLARAGLRGGVGRRDELDAAERRLRLLAGVVAGGDGGGELLEERAEPEGVARVHPVGGDALAVGLPGHAAVFALPRDDRLHVVVLDADGAAGAVERVDHPAHPRGPREVRARRPVRERDRAREVVLGVEAPERGHLGGDGRGVRGEPVKGQVEGVAPVVHGDAAAGVAPLAPPVGPPLGDAAGVRVAEGVQRDERDLPDRAGGEDAAHGLHDRRVLVVVAGEEHALRPAGVVEQALGLLHGRRERLLAEHVQAAIEGGVRDRGVVAGRRGDVDEVELAALLLEQLDVVLVDVHARAALAAARSRRAGQMSATAVMRSGAFSVPKAA